MRLALEITNSLGTWRQDFKEVKTQEEIDELKDYINSGVEHGFTHLGFEIRGTYHVFPKEVLKNSVIAVLLKD